jgi:agmatinase
MFFQAGTPEAGGWTTREVKRIIRGLAGLNFVYVPNIRLSIHLAHDFATNLIAVLT